MILNEKSYCVFQQLLVTEMIHYHSLVIFGNSISKPKYSEWESMRSPKVSFTFLPQAHISGCPSGQTWISPVLSVTIIFISRSPLIFKCGVWTTESIAQRGTFINRALRWSDSPFQDINFSSP